MCIRDRYKYGDTSVKHLERTPWYESTKVRHYVDELQDKLEEDDHKMCIRDRNVDAPILRRYS